jgi:hypothetical protein
MLGPRPGKKASTVAVPDYARPSSSSRVDFDEVDLDTESDDDLECADLSAFGERVASPSSSEANEGTTNLDDESDLDFPSD